MLSQTTERLEVLVNDPGQLCSLLDDAETKLRRIAMLERCAGIMVTRHNHSRYSLALSDMVPFGETWEQTLS